MCCFLDVDGSPVPRSPSRLLSLSLNFAAVMCWMEGIALMLPSRKELDCIVAMPWDECRGSLRRLLQPAWALTADVAVLLRVSVLPRFTERRDAAREIVERGLERLGPADLSEGTLDGLGVFGVESFFPRAGVTDIVR